MWLPTDNVVATYREMHVNINIRHCGKSFVILGYLAISAGGTYLFLIGNNSPIVATYRGYRHWPVWIARASQIVAHTKKAALSNPYLRCDNRLNQKKKIR